MPKNLLVAQSGGPTAAINATLAGIISQAMDSEEIGKIYGARHGIQGVLKEELLELSDRLSELLTEEFGALEGEAREAAMHRLLRRLGTTPAAALGSCRYKLKDPALDSSEYERLLSIFRKYEISCFVYIGGNDSMDTVWRLSEFLKERGITDITVVGAPKTIDNDLYGIDHCPGFGSAAKYIATVLSELERELAVYDTPYVLLVEMMGRNAGWLTAAAALSEQRNPETAYLIYLEERVFESEKFIRDVEKALKEKRRVIVALSEGIRDAAGTMICEYNAEALRSGSSSGYGADSGGLDAFGHKIASGAARLLESLVTEKLACKTRSIELNLLQRCAGHLLSETDIAESGELGRNAVRLALAGKNGCMSSLRRVGQEGEACPAYRVEYFAAEISEIANREKKVPESWITEDGCHVTAECVSYLQPLVQGELSCEFREGVPCYLIL